MIPACDNFLSRAVLITVGSTASPQLRETSIPFKSNWCLLHSGIGGSLRYI